MPWRIGWNPGMPREDRFQDLTYAGNLSPGETSRVLNDWIPSPDATHSLGSSTERWLNGYFSGNVSIDGNLTIVGTTTFSGTLDISSLGGTIYHSAYSSTGTVTAPATAPTVAVSATSGGSLDNTTQYFRNSLVTVNGETTLSPAATLTPSTCGAGACVFSINIAGNEWRMGAFGFRVYSCTDASATASCALMGTALFSNSAQFFTVGAMAAIHYTPGTGYITTVVGASGAAPSTNTATIDADQVALNAMCNDSASGFARCYGTLQYKPNPVGGYAQTGTTPLVVAWPGAKIQGHATSAVDDTTSGSTRNCTFTANVSLGCVMVMNNVGVKIDGLHVQSTSNGYMLNTWDNTFNQIEIGNATVSTSGTIAVAPLRIKGIWYYLRFPNLQLHANTTGTGANRGAGVLLSNASGAEWLFSGPVRWTIRDNNDVFRNDGGHGSPDSGESTTFPTLTGAFKVENVQVQWGNTGGTGAGVFFVGGNVVPQFIGVTHSDYNPTATGAFFEFGAGANAAAGCCSDAYIKDSTYFSPHANNASAFKLIANSSNAFSSMTIDNVFALHTNLIDMNSLSLTDLILRQSRSNNTCNPAATTNKIINATGTQGIECSYAVNNGISANRLANRRFTGGLSLTSDGVNTNHRHWYWSANNTLGLWEGDTGTASKEIVQFIGGKRTCWRNFASNACALDIDSRTGVDSIGYSNPMVGTAAHTATRFISTIATGTAPLTVTSTTNVANLNASSLSGATFAAPGAIGGGTPAAITGTTITANTGVVIGATLQANLGTPANGTFLYCSDCTKATPCAGGGSGALAKRLNGAWDCD